MKRSLLQQINIALGIGLLLLLINAVISYRNTLKIVKNEESVNHTHQVLAELEKTLSTLIDAETGQRGYLLTGRETYLEPYQTAIAHVNDRVDTLRRLTADNPRQQERIQNLEQAIDVKLTNLEQTINIRRKQGFEPARQLVNTGQGKQIMDEIRRQIAQMEAEENQLLRIRSKESQASIQTTLLTFTVVTCVNLLFLGVIFSLLRRNIFKRQQEAEKQNQLLIELKQEQQQLKQSEARYRSLVTATAQAVWTTNPQGEIVEDIPCWRSLTGQSETAVKGQGWLEAIHPEDREQAAQSWQNAIATKSVYENEHRVRIADGSYRHFAARAVPVLDDNGQVREWVCIHTDITERKQAEAEILKLNTTLEQRVAERTAQLQEANQTLEGFAYSVAHDLRAPLRGMQGLSEALLEDYGDQLDELGREYAQQIVNSGEQLQELIDDLLEYSRLSRAELKLQPVDLNAVVADAITQVESQLNYQHAQITVQSPLPAVLAHRNTLIQVLTNLLSNALKFVAPSVEPQVQIWAEEVEEGESGRGEEGERKEFFFPPITLSPHPPLSICTPLDC